MLRKYYFKFATKVPIHTQICVIGGGTSGSNVAAQLCKEREIFYHNIRVFEPKKNHYYQPGFTVLAGFQEPKAFTKIQTSEMFHNQIPITQYAVQEIFPEKNTLLTEDGQLYTYEQLVIGSGNELRFDLIKGAQDALEDIDCPVSTIYDYKYAIKTNKLAKQFKGGKAIFTQPPLPIKCAGAPQKIVFLLQDQWKNQNINNQIQFHTCTQTIFGVKKYADALQKLHSEKGNQISYQSQLVEVKGKERIACFKNLQTNEISEVKFDFLHLTPSQTPPSFIKSSKLSNEQGYVDVNPKTLQHLRYKNIWSLGDSSSLPTSKTAAAVFSQTPVLVNNLYNYLKYSQECNAFYDGYSACPIYVGGGKLILAEFLYDGIPSETFWAAQDQPSRLLYLLKRYVFELVYWNFVPRGQWYGRNTFFKPKY